MKMRHKTEGRPPWKPAGPQALEAGWVRLKGVKSLLVLMVLAAVPLQAAVRMEVLHDHLGARFLISGVTLSNPSAYTSEYVSSKGKDQT